jgi:hypothetical protein
MTRKEKHIEIRLRVLEQLDEMLRLLSPLLLCALRPPGALSASEDK